MNEPFQLNQMQLVIAIAKEMERQYKACGVEKPTVVTPRFNAICFHATAIVEEFGRELVTAKKGMGLQQWLKSDDTGMSSLFMAHVICGGFYDGASRRDYPRDADDFGRCHRFLEAVEGAADQVQLMADQSPQWKALASNWGELTTLYLEELPSGKCPKFGAKMKEVLKS